MKASEAFEIAKLAKTNNQLNHILARITEHARHGEFHCYYPYIPIGEWFSELQKLGYFIKSDESNGTTFWKISWDKQKPELIHPVIIPNNEVSIKGMNDNG